MLSVNGKYSAFPVFPGFLSPGFLVARSCSRTPRPVYSVTVEVPQGLENNSALCASRCPPQNVIRPAARARVDNAPAYPRCDSE